MRKLRGRKLKRQKRFIILSLTILMVFFTTGYAAFSTKIKLNTKGNIKSNKLTLDPNGGILDVTSKRVTKGKAYGELPTPTREGYIFKGWNGKNLMNLNVLESLPSDTSFSNTTARTFMLGRYVNGLAYNNYYNPPAVINYAVTQDSISLTAKSGYGVGFPFLSSANKIYTISFDSNGTANRGYSLLYYNSDGNLISYNYTTTVPTHTTKTFTTPADTYYLVVDFNGSDADTNIVFTNIQLEEGTEATEWEPYFITSDTIVTQEGAHTLTAIWEEEPVEQTEP